MSTLLRNHRRDARDSLRRLREAPLSSLMTLFVIAVALLLPALLLLVNANFEAVLDEFRQSARLTLYLEAELSEADGQGLSEDLLTHDAIAEAIYISPSQAMEEFSRASGFGDVLASIPDNPLPASIIITPVDVETAVVTALTEELQALPAVALVQVDYQWLQRLYNINRLLAATAQSLGIVVLLGLGFIIGNTIKLGVENRKAEIQVIKLVGGSDGFIARPFLYSGLFFGAGGGVLAVVLLWLISLGVREPLQALTGLAAGDGFRGLGWSSALQLILLGALVGWLAARIASWRYIRAIDP